MKNSSCNEDKLKNLIAWREDSRESFTSKMDQVEVRLSGLDDKGDELNYTSKNMEN